MTEKDVLMLTRDVSWIVTFALAWVYAASGYSSYPRFDMWLFGIMFFIYLVGIVVTVALAVKR